MAKKIIIAVSVGAIAIPIILFGAGFPYDRPENTLRNGLVAAYKLDGGPKDSSGNGFNLSDTSVSYIAGGKIRQAADYGAAVGISSISNNLGITNGPITISAWVKNATAPGTDVDFEAARHFANTVFVDYALSYQNSGGTLRVRWRRVRRGITATDLVYNITLSTSKWYHMVGTYDGTNMSFYLDGVLVAGPTAASGNGSAGSADSFGISNSSGWDRYVDEVLVWNRGLNVTEVSRLWLSGRGQTWMDKI